jgi:4-hydroxy-3-methylbut-2-enyl diphosphate reductase
VQVSEELAGVPAVRIEDLSELKTEWLKGKKRIAVTAGASTPSQLTREVIRFIEQYQLAEEEKKGVVGSQAD